MTKLLTTENIDDLYTDEIKRIYQLKLDLVLVKFDMLIRAAISDNLRQTKISMRDIWDIFGHIDSDEQLFFDALNSLSNRGFRMCDTNGHNDSYRIYW